MNHDTKVVAQLIANATDKELGTRPNGGPKRQDISAAKAIEAKYLLIRRSDLPVAHIVDRDGVPHIDVGSEAGTWSTKTSSAEEARKSGLEYLAASIGIQEWHEGEEQQRRYSRKCELWEEMGGLEGEEDERLEKAIDRIIELEGKHA